MPEPWMKFYTSDWRSDPRLKMCSPAARGMWIEMICLMHEATPYGHLLIHGQSPNEAQLASLTGISIAELPDLIAELERLGVFSRTKEGVIYSRKLVRMASKSAKARKNGNKGGNPRLRKQREKEESVNLQDNGHDKPQNPDARCQSVEVGKPTSCPFSEFWIAWPNKVAKSAAEKAWKKLTDDERREAISMIGPWFSWWREQNPNAAPIHAATYLNQKRFRDEMTTFGNGARNGNRAANQDPESDPTLRAIARAAGAF